MSGADFPTLSFDSVDKWEEYLAKNHETISGVWLKFFKKNSGVKTISYAQALDVALCYGWIDSQLKPFDDKAYLQKFSPRRTKSMWSKRNREHIARLIKEKRMQPSGMKQVIDAKKDGRWDNAYGSPSEMKIPADFLKELAKNPKAEIFFKTLNKSNTYAVAWRLHNAKKPETRQRRIKKFIEMFSKDEKLY